MLNYHISLVICILSHKEKCVMSYQKDYDVIVWRKTNWSDC